MAVVLWMVRNRRAIRRNRVFRDRTHPLEIYNDEQVVKKFRLPRPVIYELTESIKDEIEHLLPRKSLTPVLQVCLALRYYASGSYQGVIADLFGVDQSTASRTINRVTNGFFSRRAEWISFPTQAEANLQKRKFYAMQRFPDVIGCIDGTHVRIQAPSDGHEADYVNRKGYHSLNVQVICNADLIFIHVVARWPGSTHDARILRTSPIFQALEGNQPPLDGIILGDSAYMIRTWLMTPLQHPVTASQTQYNHAHSSTRVTVERSIGVLKQRWRCLRVGLHLEADEASRIIMVCCMLHNHARRLNLPQLESDTDDSDDDDNLNNDDGNDPGYRNRHNMNERARTVAGQSERANHH